MTLLLIVAKDFHNSYIYVSAETHLFNRTGFP